MKNKLKFILFIIAISGVFNAHSQYYDFGFYRNDSVKFINLNSQELKYPWIGGLNSCQFFEIDIDQNGVDDLIIFDKHGSRIIPFLKYNLCGLQDFIFAPQYKEIFPKFESWVQSHDFNMDGQKDIFTYTTAGIKVYQNVSDGEEFKLELHSPRLNSDYGGNMEVNLFCLSEDYPAIADIDGDGDLDILNFWTLGMYMDYHKNVSIENYGDLDSLKFELETRCWGYFSEHEDSNILYLDDDCNGLASIQDRNYRHAGSTMLAYDFNNNGIMDLLIGDVDFPQLFLLENGGTADSAYIIRQDTLFPSADKPIRLYSMPAPALIDVNFDGLLDLVVSPFDPSLDKAENKNSVWVYHNVGTNEVPEFEFITDNFIQGESIDFGGGAYPVLADINGNGLLDMMVGNWGEYDSSKHIGYILHSYYSSSISYVKNVGNAQNSQFQHIDDDVGNLRQHALLGLYPAVGDVDNDGDLDLIVGQSDGSIIFLENIAGPHQEPQFAQAEFLYQNIDVGEYSAPVLFDLNRDGKLDLIIGNRKGKLSYYENTGTAENPIFTLITDFLGGVDVRDYDESYFGYATPCFYVKNDTTHLFVGSEKGNIYHYRNIDNNLDGDFELETDKMVFTRDNNNITIDEGIRTAVALANLNGDGFPELIVGNYSGGLAYYSGSTPSIYDVGIGENNTPENDKVIIFPNPFRTDFKISGIESSFVDNIEIFDISGRLIKSQKNIDLIDMQGYKSGIYFVKINFRNAQSIHKKIHKVD